jgi:gliding motility-associated-like protein
MKNRLLLSITTLFLFFSLSSLQAQNNPDTLSIQGAQTLCAGDCADYFVQGLNPDCGYEWFLSNGITVGDPSTGGVTICWDQPGVFQIFVEAVNGCGDEIVLPLTVEVIDSPIPPIIELTNISCPGLDSLGTGQDCATVCAFSTVTYTTTNNTPGGVPQVEWGVTGADEVVFDGLNVTITWGAAGQGTVTLFTYGLCNSQNTLCVNILPNPTAAIASTPAESGGVISVCEGQTVFFDNNSTGATSYLWDFGGLGVSSQQDPEFTFNTAGTYEVMLIARNACWCNDTTSVTVEVSDSEIPFIDCVGTVCAGTEVTYTTPSNCGTYTWSIIGDGTITDGGGATDDFITVNWNDGPEGFISLTVNGCSGDICSEPMIESVPIIVNNAPIRGPQEVCIGAIESYSIPAYSGTDFVWSVTGPGVILEGQNTNRITVAWDNAATVPSSGVVEVQYENCYLECGGSSLLNVDILAEFYVEGPIQVCLGGTTTHDAVHVDGSPVGQWDWEVQDLDGNVVFTGGNGLSQTIDWNFGSGTYQLIATTDAPNSYCVDEYAMLVTVQAPPASPDSIAGSSVICPGEFYTYQAQSSTTNNGFVWYITDGATQLTTQGNALTYAWGPTPPYELALAQISSVGLLCESDTILLAIQPIGGVTINGPSLVCEEGISTYTADDVEGIDYQWSLSPVDAGTVISGQGSATVEINWHQPGSATINLDACGQPANFSVTVDPEPNPVINAPAGVCAGGTATITTVSSFNSYSWLDDGGNLVSTAPDPMLAPGSYELIVETATGCTGTTSFTLESLPSPNVSISTPDPTLYCTGDPPATLFATVTGTGFDYQWFYNGNPVGTNAPSFTDIGFGSYQVEVTNTYGCVTLSSPLSISEYCDPGGGGGGGGIPGLGIPSDCPGGTAVSFSWTSTGACADVEFASSFSEPIVPGTIQWYFGDGATSTDQNATVNHTYSNAGYYTATLTATVQSSGELCWGQQTVTVPAAADFLASPDCAGSPSSFTDLSTYLPGTSISNWDWNFDDPASGPNNTSILQNPTHSFTLPGTYNVTLTITHEDGCTSTISIPVIVPGPSVPVIDPVSTSCEGTATLFSGTWPADVVSVDWDFGDPTSGEANTSTSDTAWHIFSSPGTYPVSLTATNIFGCTQNTLLNVTVGPNTLGGDITSSIDPPELCEGDSLELTSSPGGVAWDWSTGDSDPAIWVTEEAAYSVTVTDGDGCVYTPAPIVVEVAPEPAANIYAVELNDYGQPVSNIFNSYSICEGEDVYLQVTGNGPYSYSWSITGDVGTQTSFTLARGNQLTVGTYDIFVDIFDFSSGCSGQEGPFTITVNELPDPFTISASGSPLCEGDLATISVDNPDPGLTYIWNTGETGTSIQTAVGGEYFVRAVNSNGCDRESNRISINAGPDIQRIPSGCLSRCEPDTLCLPNMPTIVDYQWYFEGNPIPAPEGTVADLVVLQSGTYTLEMTDIFGCTATSEPLTLDLFIGTGDIGGNVYLDINENGIIDGPDTLVNNVDLLLFENGNPIGTATTDINGNYLFNDVPSIDYEMQLDTNSIPILSTYTLLQQSVGLLGCDDSEQVDWLLVPFCPEVSGTENLAGCPGTTVTYNGQDLAVGTTSNFTFVSSLGCDSIVTVTVTTLPNDTTNLFLSACEGETVDYNGNALAAGTTSTFTFVNSAGCDSVVIVDVAELATSASTVQLNACAGSTVDYNGTPLSGGTTTDFVFTNAVGCDSIVTVEVTALTQQESFVNVAICPEETYSFANQQWPPGTSELFTFPDQFGCDSLVFLTVTAYPEVDFALDGTEVCWNAPDGSISISVSAGDGPFDYQLDGGTPQTEPAFSNLGAGNYSVVVTDSYGCAYEASVSLPEIPPLELEVDAEIFECGADGARVLATFLQGLPASTQLIWPDGSDQFFWTAPAPDNYVLTAENQCESIDVSFTVEQEIDTRTNFIYIPNAFSPNADGVNDFFRGFVADDITVLSYDLYVFDRWGDLMFYTADPDGGWDGVLRGKVMDPAVFVYYIDMTVESCGTVKRIFREGDVTLVK